MINTLIYTNDIYSQKAIKLYKTLGKVYYLNESIAKEEIQILVISLDVKINSTRLDEFINLKFLVSPTTGTNHIDLDYCLKRNIKVITLKNETKFLKKIKATSQFTFALIILLSRNIINSFFDFKHQKLQSRLDYKDQEFEDFKIGILGCGRVGTETGRLLQNVGFNIFGYDPYISDKHFKINNFKREKNLNDFLKKIDILVICINYNIANFNFIDNSKLKQLKKGAILINTSRGEVLDEQSLINCLKSKHLKGAALDVLSIENNENLELKKNIYDYIKRNNNLIITPHIAGNTYKSIAKTQEFVAKKVQNQINLS